MARLIFGKLLAFLRSSLLALSLLIVVLIACLVGVMFLPEQVAMKVIFASLWFNGLLALLVLNIAFCFFPRIWHRKVTAVSLGLIIFHLSFILLFVGIVYDSLFYFRGTIRLTEGETLDLGNPQSYDRIELGRFFKLEAKLKGQVAFHKLLTRYMVDGKNKGVANEVSIGDGSNVVQGIVYTTRHLKYNGLKFYRKVDGFSPLFILWDSEGRELYGAYSPLQSFKQKDDKYLYTTGTANAPDSIPFPQEPMNPVFRIQTIYDPNLKIAKGGDVTFRVWRFSEHHSEKGEEIFSGRAATGEKVKAGDYYLSMNEVRYWASMDIRCNPGLPLILTSLWIGLGGIILTTVARLINNKMG